MVVEFSNHRGEPARHGPFDRLRFTTSELLDDVNQIVIARQHDQFWKVESNGRSFARLDCVERLRMRFESVLRSRARRLVFLRSRLALDGFIAKPAPA